MKISLLVLPFRNWSSSTQDDFLCDGITEELIYTLTRLDQLRVASRTSSFFFKNKDLQPKQIGEQLGISHLLEGSIRRYDEKIRDLAARAELQKTMAEDKRERAERLAFSGPMPPLTLYQQS